MGQHTVFGDVRQRAIAVYRVKTRSSEYIVGIHEQRGRKLVVVRGKPGTDREHVIARDSDPRIGDRSLFDVPVSDWPGLVLEVATMTSSTIDSVVVEADPVAIAAVGLDGKIDRNPWARPDEMGLEPAGFSLPPPQGMSDSPRIVPLGVRGTSPASMTDGHPARENLRAKQVVVGQAVPQPVPQVPPSGPQGQGQPQAEVPYPQRHVGYAESVAQLLRSLARRDKIFDDLGGNRELRDRLRRALDDSAMLLEQIRRRDRK